jgi:hypothetical protein
MPPGMVILDEAARRANVSKRGHLLVVDQQFLGTRIGWLRGWIAPIGSE